MANLGNTLANRELERRGLTDKAETRLLNAKYYLDLEANPRQRWETASAMILKYVGHLEREGWKLLDSPVVKRVNIIDEQAVQNSSLYIPDSANVWHPNMLATENTIPQDHSWVHPGQDLYIIWVKAERKAQAGSMEIDDDVLQTMIDKEDSTLEGIAIH